MLNRPDSLTAPGGDTVQMLKTGAALRDLGVTVDVAYDLSPDLRGYDLAHLFNLQRPRETFCQMQICRRHGIPTALSSIIWDFWRVRLETQRRWLALRRILPLGAVAALGWAEANGLGRLTRTWRMQRKITTMADVILPNSAGEADLLCRWFGRRLRDKMAVIPNAVDEDWAGAASRTSLTGLTGPTSAAQVPAGCVLQVGRIEPLKNQIATIRAVSDSNIPLVFVGDVPAAAEVYGKRFRECAERRGNVVIFPSVPHDELPVIYARAKVHVLPSFGETTGLVSLEAALFGCNIVSTEQGPTREYLGPWAWYCSPADVGSIRRAITAARASPPRPQLRERILRYFTWRETARRTLATYERILNDS
jgi:glycosyltransferase involved in cell wall biosynthesis